MNRNQNEKQSLVGFQVREHILLSNQDPPLTYMNPQPKKDKKSLQSWLGLMFGHKKFY